MPEFLSLGEAARTLGMSEDELKRLAQDRRIRAFMDGGSWRFRKADVEEEARRRGMGSDPELPLSDLDIESPLDTGSDDQIDLTEFQIGVAPPDLAPPSEEMPFSGTGTDEEIMLVDDRSAPQSASNSSSKIIGIHPAEGKKPSDSDVRLVPEHPKSASDSDVRLGGPGLSDSDVTLVADEAGSSQEVVPMIPPKAQAPKGKPKSKPAPVDDELSDPNATVLQPSPVLDEPSDELNVPSDSDSDFDLTPSSVIDMLEPESGSDFELTALDGSSDEIDAAPPSAAQRRPSDSDVTGMQASSSGVNLGRPSDSGINLQAVGGFDMASADSIELEPIDEENKDLAKSGGTAKLPRGQGDTSKLADRAKDKPKPKPKKEEPVDLSATALPIRQEKDIFEDTDFDVDVEAIDSNEDDRTVQLEARSDFDLEDDSDSASEVFAVDEDEDDVDANAATAMGPAVLGDDGEFDDEGSSDEGSSAWDVEEEAAAPVASMGRSTASPALVSASGPGPEWGGIWVGLLGFTSVLVLLGAFMGMDLVRNLYYFQSNAPSAGLIEKIAGLF